MNSRLMEFTRSGGTDAALSRLAKYYPALYDKVKETREKYRDLYELKADDFDKVTALALKSLIKDGICKKPKF